MLDEEQKLTCSLPDVLLCFLVISCYPARDVSLLYWTDSTCASEHGHAEVFPKRFNAARVPEGDLLVVGDVL